MAPGWAKRRRGRFWSANLVVAIKNSSGDDDVEGERNLHLQRGGGDCFVGWSNKER